MACQTRKWNQHPQACRSSESRQDGMVPGFLNLSSVVQIGGAVVKKTSCPKLTCPPHGLYSKFANPRSSFCKARSTVTYLLYVCTTSDVSRAKQVPVGRSISLSRSRLVARMVFRRDACWRRLSLPAASCPVRSPQEVPYKYSPVPQSPRFHSAGFRVPNFESTSSRMENLRQVNLSCSPACSPRPRRGTSPAGCFSGHWRARKGIVE